MGKIALGEVVKGRNDKEARWHWAKLQRVNWQKGEMVSGQKDDWARWQRSKTVKGEMGKGRDGIGRNRKKSWAKWEWAKWDWANWEDTKEKSCHWNNQRTDSPESCLEGNWLEVFTLFCSNLLNAFKIQNNLTIRQYYMQAYF